MLDKTGGVTFVLNEDGHVRRGEIVGMKDEKEDEEARSLLCKINVNNQ